VPKAKESLRQGCDMVYGMRYQRICGIRDQDWYMGSGISVFVGKHGNDQDLSFEIGNKAARNVWDQGQNRTKIWDQELKFR